MAFKETYEQFIEKFKPNRTTDDCFTPDEVYEAVLQWAVEELHLEGREVVRPFWPGGDYEHYDYPEGCVVIDNPPFSIYAEVVRFYLSRGIHFLLFAPGLAQLVMGADVCYLCTFNNVTYQNGALVRTCFTTNLVPGTRLWTCHELRRRVQQAADDYYKRVKRNLKGCKKNGAKKKYAYPDHLITAASVGKIAVRGVELRIPTHECTYVRRAGGVDLFGGGLLLSLNAAARRAAAEREADERAKLDEANLIAIVEEPYSPPEDPDEMLTNI